MKKRFWCILPALCLALALLTATALAAGEEAETESDAAAAQGGEDLFYQYMLQLAREQTTSMLMRDQIDTAGSRLTGNNLSAYNQLVPQLKSIAQSGGSTVLPVTLNSSGSIDLGVINLALLSDLPYDLYWYDKSASEPLHISSSGANATFTFAVAQEYSDGVTKNGKGKYTMVDAGRLTHFNVAAAVATANSVVADNEWKSDYGKLAAYKAWICNNVEYNHDAAAGNVDEGNPWQLIYVFDGDPGTKVVCEGYSKAFKFLCDLSTFSGETQCYLVTGHMVSTNSGGSKHMWNIVTLEGKSYHVDVTYCDQDPVVDDLFLKGVTRPAALIPNKDFSIGLGKATLVYEYYRDELPWSNDILDVSTTDYEAPVPVYTDVASGGYSYCLDGRTVYLKPTSGTAYLILARFENGRMTEAKVKTVTGESGVGPLTAGNWMVFSVDSTARYIPQGTPQELIVPGS